MTSGIQAWLGRGSFFDFGGCRIFYRREGRGEPLLLVHGYPFNSYDWHKIWGDLVSRRDVIAPDMLGMGFSDKPPRHRYSVFGHADMHEALLRELGIGEFDVLAHDLGVTVVQEMLARRMEGQALPRLRSVVFLNGGLFHEVYRPRLVQKLLCSPAGRVLGPITPDAAVRAALKEMFGPDTQLTRAEADELVAVLKHNGGKRVNHLVGRFVLDRKRHRDRFARPLERGFVPMRLIDGNLDPNSGAHLARRYRELVPDPDVVDLPTVGHWPQLEAPRATVGPALEFFDRQAS
ncbi:MAG: alpha/beta fold hydrolase [Segniliparus sp.]|uniref:alpha/beta fold hydrolase n=1 Tax=Segniliparus sp. TaxID=2804064 RepID=UPI003F3D11AA